MSREGKKKGQRRKKNVEKKRVLGISVATQKRSGRTEGS